MYEKLARVELRGRDYERVEKLHQGVEWAQHMLEETGDLAALKADMYIVNVLIQKLPASWQDKWLEHCEAQEGGVQPGKDEWDQLRAWLLKGYKLAVRARNLNAVTLRSSASTTQPSKSQGGTSKTACGKCHRMGHRSAECPFEGSLAEINAVQEDEKEMSSRSVAFA